MNNINPELIYDGQENEALYLMQLELDGSTVTLSHVLSNSISIESAKSELAESVYNSVLAKCDDLYMTPYFYKFENGKILIIAFGEFQPGRYMLYRFF